MIELLFWIIIFCLTIYLLDKCADIFTDSSEDVGRILGISPYVVGVVLVAIGTSSPELFTSFIATLEGKGEVATSNVIGTVIANTLLGFGLASLLSRNTIKVEHKGLFDDLLFFILSTFILYIFARDGFISIRESLFFLFCCLMYLINLKKSARIHYLEKKEFSMRPFILFLASLFGLYILGKFVIISLIKISEITSISSSKISSIFLAVGTSIPEISVAISAARKEKFDLLAGDIVGSNVFDILFIIGFCGIFSKLIVEKVIIDIGLPFVLFSSLITWIIFAEDRKVEPIEGLVLIILYVVFALKLFEIL